MQENNFIPTLSLFFQTQKELDVHIEEEHPREEGEERFFDKALAFRTELGELLNEYPKVFKFWSNKENNKEKGLEEYVDGLHFILSIGLELGCTLSNDKEIEKEKKTILSGFSKNLHVKERRKRISSYFTLLFNLVSTLEATVVSFHETKEEKEKEIKRVYQTFFIQYLVLGGLLGFTKEEITMAYFQKNKKNHERQKTGY